MKETISSQRERTYFTSQYYSKLTCIFYVSMLSISTIVNLRLGKIQRDFLRRSFIRSNGLSLVRQRQRRTRYSFSFIV